MVFTSARADTARQSTRMTMFREMEEANFEVRARADVKTTVPVSYTHLTLPTILLV